MKSQSALKTDTKFKDPFSEETWRVTYKDHNDNTIDDTLRRVAKFVASAENDKDYWEQRFYDMLTDFKVTPGGRIYANAGTEFNGTTLINCFVSPKDNHDIDSINSIINDIHRCAITLKSEGGFGINLSHLRPRGAFIEGIGVESPGAVKFAELFDKTSEIVTSGSGVKSTNKKSKGKIRKGAMMLVLDCCHGDIEEFIRAKQQPGRLTKFNISVNCYDEFMDKIQTVSQLKKLGTSQEKIDKIDKWELWHPDTTDPHYKTDWDGDFKAWKEAGYKRRIYKTVSATGLWDNIMEANYNRAEPGVLFLDRANYYNPLMYKEKIFAVNPCGEQTLAPGGICDLGSINLTQFINENNTGFDLEKLKKSVRDLNRFLDNVNSLSEAPLPEYVNSMRKKRRVGIGILGWGSALYMLKVRFGSEKAAELREKVMSTIAREAYMSSIDLAEEKGMFEYCDPDLHAEGNFVKNLDLPEKYMEKMRRVGIRNSSLLSIQPTGNSSIQANVVSGGLEPIFMPEYVRTVIVNQMPDEIKDVCPKWYEGEWYETDMFKTAYEGDEEILKGEHNGIVYKIDKNRGLTREVLCQDYGVRYLSERGEWDPNADWAVSTTNLSVQAHVEDLKGFARWLDSSASKCVVKGTKINTTHGILNIEDFTEEFSKEDSFNDINYDIKVLDENGDLKKVTAHYYGGKKECVEIRFSNGKTIQCALTHKFKTENGFISAKDLNVGNKIFYRNNEIVCTNENIPLPDIEKYQKRNSKQIKFPKYLTLDFALFLGMWLADGFISKNSIGIVEKNDKLCGIIKPLMKSIFGRDSTVITDKRNGVRTHVIHSRAVVSLFKEHFGYDCVTKKIPGFILKANKKIKIKLINGLTLDGYIKRNSCVLYEGYSKNIVENIAMICAELGYFYSIGSKNVKGGLKSKTSHSIAIYHGTGIEPLEEHKKINLTAKKDVQRYVEPNKHKKIISDIGTGIKETWIRRNFKNSLKKDFFVRESFLNKLGVLYDDKLSCIKITSIENIGQQEVYDIEVEDTHSYLIGGIVSHNTINVPYDYPFENFKQVYIDAYNSGYIKGVTTYRAGTMTSVLSAKEEKDADNYDEEIIQEDVKMPAQTQATINTIKADGKKWYLTTVWNEQQTRPVAFFVHTNHHEKSVQTNDAVERLMTLAKNKGVPAKWIYDTFQKIEKDNNATKIARAISLNLRHGVLIKNVVATLDHVEDVFVGSFLFQIRKYLASFIKDGEKVEGETCLNCGSHNVVFREGCKLCLDCGSSKCG